VIYQHRLVVARGGRLEKRHEQFQRVALDALDGHGSQLVGAWEIWIGVDAGCAVWQLREHESLASWEKHRERAVQDGNLRKGQSEHLYPSLDFVDTAILRLADSSPGLPTAWPAIETVRGKPRNYIEQRIIYLRPDRAEAHHALYFEKVSPALTREGASTIGFFDTVIGPGTTNTGSHRSVEIRRFPDLACWQRWREAQDQDPELSRLLKNDWLKNVERVESTLLRPMDYSRIR
jgi:hypothetical protein